MKQGAQNHDKFKILARLLKVWLCTANGIMERLWLTAAELRPDGAVGRWSNLSIAEYCAMPFDVDVDAFVNALIEAKFLDRVEGPNRLIIHDWPDHCTHFTHNKIARQELHFANGATPNLKRLDPRYKAAAAVFYGVSAQSGKMSAQSGQKSAHSGKTGTGQTSIKGVSAQSSQKSAQSSQKSAQSGKMSAQDSNHMPQTGVGVSAQSGKMSAQKALQRARPTPTPTPMQLGSSHTPLVVSSAVPVFDAQKETAAAALNGHHTEEFQWKLAAAAVQSRFSRTEDAFVFDLVAIAKNTLKQSGGDMAKLTDAALADAISEATFTDQKSAAGYRKTLPVVIRNWCKPRTAGQK